MDAMCFCVCKLKNWDGVYRFGFFRETSCGVGCEAYFIYTRVLCVGGVTIVLDFMTIIFVKERDLGGFFLYGICDYPWAQGANNR